MVYTCRHFYVMHLTFIYAAAVVDDYGVMHAINAHCRLDLAVDRAVLMLTILTLCTSVQAIHDIWSAFAIKYQLAASKWSAKSMHPVLSQCTPNHLYLCRGWWLISSSSSVFNTGRWPKWSTTHVYGYVKTSLRLTAGDSILQANQAWKHMCMQTGSWASCYWYHDGAIYCTSRNMLNAGTQYLCCQLPCICSGHTWSWHAFRSHSTRLAVRQKATSRLVTHIQNSAFMYMYTALKW